MRLGERETPIYLTEYIKTVKTNKGIEALKIRSTILVSLPLSKDRKISISWQVHRRPVLTNKRYEGGEKEAKQKKKQSNVQE